MNTLILNGLAASVAAWDLCEVAREAKIISYIEQLDGEADRQLSRARALVIGWSMGASTALRLALEKTDQITGLILLAPTPRMMQDEKYEGMSQRRLMALKAGALLTGDNFAGFFPLPEDKPNPYLRDSEENLSRGLEYLVDTDLREKLREKFGVKNPPPFPVYIFHSEKDGIVRLSQCKFLLEEVFPSAKFTLVPGYEHALPIWIPEQIDAAAKEIIKKG